MAKAKDTTDLKTKLSRKIAELTMVVHLLFTRNHEREVEIEALKSVYTKEMVKIQGDVKGRVSWLEGQLEDLEKTRVMLDVKNNEISKHKQQAQVLLEKETELRRELDDNVHLLAIAEKDIIKLREQLVSKASYDSAQNDIVKQLKEEISRLQDSNNDLHSKLSVKNKKQKELLKQLDELQTKAKGFDNELKEAMAKKGQIESLLDNQSDWQTEIDRLKSDIVYLTECQKKDQEKCTHLEKKNKQLQLFNNELESSNRQLSLQIQQLINDKNKKKDAKKAKAKQTSPEAPRCTPAYEKDEELERLRREVQRYRLEISNRESNFNRVFAEQRPVFTDGRAKRSNSSPDSARFPNLTGTRGVSPSHLPSLK